MHPIYQQLVDFAPEGICATDAQGRITFANRRAQEWFGGDPSGRMLAEFAIAPPPEDSATPNYHLRLPDGREVRCSFGDIPDSSRVAILTDVTAERRERESISQQMKAFESLVEVLPVGIGIARDPECRDVRVNPAFSEMLGLNPAINASKTGDTADQLPFRVFQGGKEIDGSELPMQVAARENRSLRDQELTIVRSDGRTIEELGYASPLQDSQGRAQGSLGVFVDITERKRAESRLRHAEERFRRLYESNIVGICSSDDEQILEANDVFLQMIGYTREDLEQGRLQWRHMTAPEYLKISIEAAQTLATTGAVGPFEKAYVRKDGSRVPVLLGVIRLNNEPRENLCFIVDLTERKKLERRVFEAQKLESVGLLAAGIAHDFNNLLVGVIGNASLAQELLSPTHEARELMDVVVKTGEQAAHLTRQMLAYSGKGRFVVELLDISRLFGELTEIVKPSISKKIALKLEFTGGLDPVEADRSQMQQIFTNLVLNASEAIGDREGVITIRTGEWNLAAVSPDFPDLAPGRYVFLEVTDTGCGMDEDTQERIFEPFFSTKFTGRGLGLAAVAGIVRTQQGAVQIASKPGQGSRFTVLLPVAHGAAMSSRRADAHPSRRNTVLVVDDEQIVREIARRALERGGYQVLTAEEGDAALEKLPQHPEISVVLLDMSMPGRAGAEVLAAIRLLRPNLPVVLASGFPEEQARQHFAGHIVSGFLAKPFRARELVQAIESAIVLTDAAAPGAD